MRGAPSIGARVDTSARTAALVGVVDGSAAAALYLVGWERAFSFDASRTVAHFVTAPSLKDVFRQDRFNNHPLFSLLEHVLHAATGSQDERLLRVLPVLCGAAAVGLVAAAVAVRFGAAAGHVSGATLAVNALAVRQFREVRGYSLVTLAAIVATLSLFRLLRLHHDKEREDGRRRPTWRATACYVTALVVAVGTHLFALGLIVVHALVVVARRDRLGPWLWRWAAVVGLGLTVQGPAIVDGLSTPPRYIFQPAFPLRLTANLLGGPAAIGMGVLVLAGWLVLRSQRWVRWSVAGTAVIAAAAWLAGPSWLDSRFFIWLAPATAVAAGVGAARWRRLVLLAGACVVVQVLVLAPDLTTDEVPNRTAAGFVRRAQASGERVCALGRTRAGLLAYVDDVAVVWSPAHVGQCDIAVEAAGPKKQPLLGPACRRFAFVLPLPAKHPGAVFADRPLTSGDHWLEARSAPLCGET